MKFNKRATKTVNYEGGEAYKLSPEMELYSLAVTSLLQPKFYESDESQLRRLQELVARADPEFVAKLAIYAREQMYLRQIPIVLTVELARHHNGDSLVSRTLCRVIQRPDEITEALAYYQHVNKASKLNKLSKQIQKGIRKAFGKFDEYQLAKYNRRAQVTLKDAVFLTHPKGKLITKLVKDQLATPYTWETQLSERGGTKEVWEELIESQRLGYMALLRNLRNILNANVSPRHIGMVAARIENPAQVRKSKQLPFRFYSAYRMLQDAGGAWLHLDGILRALERAARISAENIKGYDYDTRVVIACDVSGSMMHPISAHSIVEYYDVGIILAMLLKSRCKSCITGMFGDTWKVIPTFPDTILPSVDVFRRREGEVGYSTNGYKVIEYLLENRVETDKVMMFTDMQLWDSQRHYVHDRERSLRRSWQEYKQIAPGAKLYLFDMAGYGRTPISVERDDVFLISGWSDKIFDTLDALEKGEKALDMINSIML